MTSQPLIVQSLREAVPELGPIIDEHIADNEDVLTHLVFGDLTRFVLEAHARGQDDLVGRCLRFLDEALHNGDQYTKNLVAVSFVENTQPWTGERATFVRSWPAALRAEAERQGA